MPRNNLPMEPGANLRLGLKCNADCLFCTVANDEEETMTTAQVKNLISRYKKESDIVRLTITGGEPTLREDLAEVIKFARSINIETIDLQTNAFLLADEEYLIKLKQAGLNFVTVGFPSHIKEKYNYLTKTKSYEKAASGLKNCVKHGLVVSIYHVINQENYKDLIGLIDFCLDLSKDMQFAFAFLRPNGNTLKNKFIVPKLSWMEPYIYEMLEYLKSKKIHALLEGVPLCYMQGFENKSAETHRMRIPAVKYLSEGKLTHDSLHDHILHNLKRKSEDCNICRLNEICAGVWQEYADIHGVDELFPVFHKVDLDG